jgi:hypothetical protein
MILILEQVIEVYPAMVSLRYFIIRESVNWPSQVKLQ